MGFQSFRMMDGGGSGDDGLIEDHDALEDDSINFWATLGVSPHVHVVDTVHPVAAPPVTHHEHLQQQPPTQQHQHPHQHQHQHQQLEFVEQPVRRELFAMEADPRLEPFLGMEFESGEAAKTFYIAYAGRVGFSVRIARSRRSKCNESVIMLRFVCSREGFCREKRVVEGKKTRKRAASVREGCRAMLEVIRRGDGKWVVTKLVKEHNHQVGLPSKVHYIATEGDSELEPYMSMEFESLEIAKTFYYSYASRVGFEARVRQSRRSLHDESLKMLKLVCSKHRYHSGRDNNAEDAKMGLLLDPAREGCEALFEIIRKDNGRWMVSKLVLTHSHDLTPSPPSKVHCVRSQGEILVIAKNFDDTRNLLLNGQDSRYPREIRYNDLGPEDAENLLQYFKKTQEENPAFFYSVQVEANNCMTNIFWADAKARMAYTYFGDAVVFDTTYKNDKELIPIVTFTGLNHHAQSVVFGCALLVDESEASYLWLFEKWLEAMSSRHPVSFVTDLDRAMATAIAKVFPNTRHRFSKKHILATIQEELPEFYSTQNPFDDDLRRCIEESETIEFFESCWDAILERYDLRENSYMQFLYNIRHQWVPIYLKDGFFAEIFMSQKSGNIDKVVQKYFNTKTPLRVAVRQLGQAIATRYEKEAQEDFVTMSNKPFLRTASPVERQAASIYTRIIFNRFQEEFLESLGYHVDKIEDGVISKFRVVRNGDAYTVTYNASEMSAHCSCCMFEFSGILCRHALKVFIVVGMRKLPKDYILKRWTRNAKSGALLDDCGVGFQSNCEEPSTARYSDLCRDATRCAKEGATSVEAYKVAKDALQKAISEVVSVKQQKEQETLQSYIKSQKKQSRKPGKVSPRDASRKNMKKMAPKESSLEIDS